MTTTALAAGRPALGRARSALGGLLPDAVAGAVIALVTWPTGPAAPSPGIDASWIVGLHLAARMGLAYGSDILFTYGPLGFLGFPTPYLAWTSGLALVFVGGVHLVACAWFFRLGRDTLGAVKAFVLVLAAAFTFPYIVGWTLFGVLIFAAAAVAIARRKDHPSGALLAVGLGLAVGFAGLGKLNIAAVSGLIALVGVAASARDPLRSSGWFAAAGVVSFAVLWLMTGQALGNIPVYVRAAVEVSAGYADSMGQVDPQTPVVWGEEALATLILAALAWQRAVELPRRDRAALLALTTLMVFATYKAGFTRAGVGMTIYLVTLLALWPPLIPRRSAWPSSSLAVAGILIAFLAVSALSVGAIVDPVGRMSAFLEQSTTVLTERASAASATRTALRDQYGLAPQALSLLSGQTTEVEPWEAAVAYAYPELVWRPEPVFQPYSAYTRFLDAQNAHRLAGTSAPARILWLTPDDSPLSIDGRNVWFDGPASKMEMVCRYLPLAAAPTWQVLGRVPDRCGTPSVIATVSTRAGVAVSVPRNLPPGILTMRVSGVGADLLTRVLSLAYKTPPWWVLMNGTRWRIPPPTADEAAIIAATTDVGYVGALTLGPPPDTVTVGPDPGGPGDGSPLTVTFEVVPVTPTR